MVVAGSDIGGNRTEHVEWSLVADSLLPLHIHLDIVEGHVAGAFDHNLHATLAAAVHQFAQHLQLAKLRRIRSIGQTSGA